MSMKKIILTGISLFFLVSCWTAKIELTNDTVNDSYKISDRSINLSNKNLDYYVNLNNYMTGTEVNNIYLNNNNIEIININKYDKLWTLDISNNNIRFISDLNLPLTIRHLNLSNNNLTNLQGLDKYTKLKTLDLSYNNLEESDIVIKGLDDLKYINIEWNNISTVWLDKINDFNRVYLSNNKIPFENK